MRIISGKYKGRTISPPGNLPVRPTTDFAKTGLFNILGNNFDIDYLKVLDLFAGTGNITFEFASRGAKSVTAVEQNFNCIKFIRDTCEKLGMDNVRSVKYDAFKFIKGTTDKFDCIFADPPYDLKEGENLPVMIFEYDLLSPGGWFIYEHSEEKDYSDLPHFREKREYGKVGFSIFQKEN